MFLVAHAAIPEKITVMQGQQLNFRWGITAAASTESTGSFDCRVKLFNFIPIKTVSVSVTPKYYVIPSGEAIGVKVYSDGILVVGMGDVHDENGRKCEPAKKAGINIGDRIIAVNGESVQSTSVFTRKVNDCDGVARLCVIRDDDMLNIDVNAVYSAESKSYKVGLWVRDSTAGIGTLTFYNPENSTFAALGHGICDSDTKDIITVKRGSVTGCNIRNVEIGTSGTPGELIGDFSGDEVGDIVSNCGAGIYGKAKNIPQKEAVEVASRFQVKEGKAHILCDVDGNGPKTYEVEITKVSKSARESNKSFVLKVTDAELIEKTGGIVQGMSGSPILQNDMLIGAVTHVFVNDPKRGYGIFAENMLDETNKIK
ncbi:MAG: SpoIVB peptidase [Clostridia bacterium]|nr:SpoIVB peptidase [Clostridia bacterium]